MEPSKVRIPVWAESSQLQEEDRLTTTLVIHHFRTHLCSRVSLTIPALSSAGKLGWLTFLVSQVFWSFQTLATIGHAAKETYTLDKTI